jgi:hypothetical protein
MGAVGGLGTLERPVAPISSLPMNARISWVT